jgi:hypothetical protein
MGSLAGIILHEALPAGCANRAADCDQVRPRQAAENDSDTACLALRTLLPAPGHMRAMRTNRSAGCMLCEDK